MNWSPRITPKRGVSEMLSYVLALIIVVGLSIGVYVYLQLQAPKPRLACGDDVFLSIDPTETTCMFVTDQDKRTLQLTILFENRGRRSISGAYIRLGPPQSKIRSLINSGEIFFKYVPETQSSVLTPDATLRYTKTLNEGVAELGENILEVEPVIGQGLQTTVCEQALITQRIQCNNAIITP